MRTKSVLRRVQNPSMLSIAGHSIRCWEVPIGYMQSLSSHSVGSKSKIVSTSPTIHSWCYGEVSKCSRIVNWFGGRSLILDQQPHEDKHHSEAESNNHSRKEALEEALEESRWANNRQQGNRRRCSHQAPLTTCALALTHVR